MSREAAISALQTIVTDAFAWAAPPSRRLKLMRSANTVPADTPVAAPSAPAKPGNGDGRMMEEEGDGANQ